METRGTVTYWTGPIDFVSFEALKNTLQRYPQIKSLSLDSAGGRIGAARGMAQLVSEAGLDTTVNGICSSACTLVFIAGEKRTLNRESRIGFHGYKLLGGIQTINIEAEQLRDLEMFQKRGVDALFLDHAYSVPFDEIWFPDRDTLRQSGVITN